MIDHSATLPDCEAFVSRTELAGRDLLIRFVTDYHPGSDAQAYEVEIRDAADPHAAMAYVERCRADGDYVYVFERDGRLVLQTEHGDECEIAAGMVNSRPSEFDAGELKKIAERVYQWYSTQTTALRAAHARIENARGLLIESARRVEIKAASHREGGTAAALYAQQLALIHRILGMLES